ncbi:MAG: transglutaminaseTgpA domain-containing protein [Frankiaceae bacterium]
MSPRTRLALFAALATALTSTSLAAVYVDHGWLWPTVGGIVAVLIGAEAGSRLGSHLLLPTLWRAVGAVTGLTMFVCARYASTDSYLGFVPTPAAISRLRELADQAFSDINSLAAPVPSRPGLVLVTTMGVGAIAILVDLLTVRAALTGLPLLALYSVPEWLSPHGTGPLPFILGAVGYLALLLREGRDRTTRWGRAVELPAGGPHPELVPDASPHGAIGQTGRRIGFAALGIALVVPPLLPTLDHPHLLGLGSGTGTGTGGTSVTYSPIAKIYGYLRQGQPTQQLVYQLSPGAEPTYLQWTTLDTYTDNLGWSQTAQRADGHANDQLPAPSVVQRGVRSTTFSMHVQIDSTLDLHWLPVPENTTSVGGHVSDQWVYDADTHTIFSLHDNTRGMTYDLTAVSPNPSLDTLTRATVQPRADAPRDVQPYYDIPANVSRPVAAVAVKLTKGYPTPYQKALALQDFFAHTTFVYDTSTRSGDGPDRLADFVITSKHGFCEQFAAAMAVMARMIGIPARVAVGFTPGTPTGRPGEYRVTSADAHAWPELYFEGIGWLRFEPTPRSDRQATPPRYATQSPELPAGSHPGQPGVTDPRTGAGGPTAPHGFPKSRVEPIPNGGTDFPIAPAARPAALSARSLALISLGGLLLLALAALPLSRSIGRRRSHARARDPIARAHLAWHDVLVDAADLGMRVPASDSPRTVARRLTEWGHLSPGAAAAVRRLAAAEERARYAPGLGAVGDVEGDARLVSRDLRAAVTRWVRLRARLLPSSALRATSGAVGRGVQAALDAMDAVAGRLVAAARRAVRRPGMRGA